MHTNKYVHVYIDTCYSKFKHQLTCKNHAVKEYLSTYMYIQIPLCLDKQDNNVFDLNIQYSIRLQVSGIYKLRIHSLS